MTTGRLPVVRAVRSLALTTSAVGAGLLAHWHAGGTTPHPVALLVLLLVLTVPVARLSARQVSPVVAAVVLGAGQGRSTCSAPWGTTSSHASSHGGHEVVHLGPLPAGSPDGGGLTMLGLHLVVTLALAALWSRGERASSPSCAGCARRPSPLVGARSAGGARRGRRPRARSLTRWHPSRAPPLPVS
ncbi:hypothetical protein [Janibacter melonis]|uniref:hypothetical protein n=1 Tax=Janibacter melonis TaxID=262209 RepID=UPI002094C4B8|nr:hypothetical protein [Janibacter melonis]